MPASPGAASLHDPRCHIPARGKGESVNEPALLDLRDKVRQAEVIMRDHGIPVEIPAVHHFANKGTKRGIYAREIRIPAGTLLTGKIHKYEQVNILSYGEIEVLTERGVVLARAPFTIVSPPGTKRIAYAHTDCVWTTIHATDETELDRIEAEFIAQSEADYLDFVRLLPEAVCPG